MSKCLWCGKKSHETKEIVVLSTAPVTACRHEVSFNVCPEHEEDLRRFYDRVRQYALLFIMLTVILPLCLIISAIFKIVGYHWAGYLFSASLAALGLVLVIFPFCSQSTFDFMSVATSSKLTRILGGVIFVLGIIEAVLGIPNC